MQAGVPAFPALEASEYEQGFDFSLSTPQNLNTFLPTIPRIPSWSVFNFQTRNVKFLKLIGKIMFFFKFHW